MKKEIFVTGIDTDAGKTVVSAIICKAFQADYFKPVQAGDLDNSDSHKIARYLENWDGELHPNAYALTQPMSPHAAAYRDNVTIELDKIKTPESERDLLIEGAGGLLVPINDTQTVADVIQPHQKVILVSRHYLGSINHTLLSVAEIKRRGLAFAGVIFVGDENADTESIIEKQGEVNIIGRVDWAEEVNAAFVTAQANKLRTDLITALA
jgi:dethiobiotin synthetase